MASRILRILKCFGTKRKLVSFRFFPQGNSATPMTLANGLLQGDGVRDVTRTAQGVFLATLEDSYFALWAKHASIQLSAAAARFPQFGDVSNLGSLTAAPVTVVIRNIDATAVAQDMAANANNSISVDLEFEDSNA